MSEGQAAYLASERLADHLLGQLSEPFLADCHLTSLLCVYPWATSFLDSLLEDCPAGKLPAAWLCEASRCPTAWHSPASSVCEKWPVLWVGLNLSDSWLRAATPVWQCGHVQACVLGQRR